MIKIKTAKEIELIKSACTVVSEVLSQLKEYLHPGVSTSELDRKAKEQLSSLGASSAFKDYRGYPANICTSVNEKKRK